MERRNVLVGAGAYGRTVAELAKDCGFDLDAIVDDDPDKIGSVVDGIPIALLTGWAASGTRDRFLLGLGGIESRKLWNERLCANGFEPVSLIHPRAFVSPSALIGPGCLIHMGAVVWTQAELGRAVFVSPGATVTHHARIGSYCHIAVGSVVGAGVSIGGGVLVGTGAVVSPTAKTVGEGCVIGAGAVVVKEAKAGHVLIGSPARPVG